jgi:hypothetical protein
VNYGDLFFPIIFFLLGRRGAGGLTSSAPPTTPLLPSAPATPQAQAQTQAQQATQQAAFLQQSARAADTASKTPRPWPQVVPAGLPAFPGPGWKPAEPPPGAVVSRAWQLLSKLWSGGVGTFKAEQTGSNWYVYQARWTGPKADKKGVVAWKQSGAAKAPSPRQSDARV